MIRACILAALLAAALVQQQPPPRYAETVDVSSVLIDVRVLDDRGAPVVGLEPADFQVSIGGRNVRVQSTAWIDGRTAPVGAPLSTPASAPAAPPPAGRLIVFLIQRNISKGYAYPLMQMLEQSRAVVRGLAQEDRVAILSFDTSLKIWTDFTNDSATLDRLLERGVL